MRRLRPAAVLLVLVAGSLGAFPLPPPLETGHLLGRGLPAGVPPVPLADRFFALGWSRDNAFAFLERRTYDNAVPSVRFRVMDLVDDRILAEREWADWGEDLNLESWWSARESEVDALFARYRLQPIDNQLGLFPLIVDNEFYTLVLRPGAAPGQGGWIDRLEVAVRSTGRGLKTVWDGRGYWRWATLLGYVPSPFENRVALVLLVQPSGWMGPRQPLRFLVTGLSLKAGFPLP